MSADIAVGAVGARAHLGTGASENCVPADSVCVVEYHPSSGLHDATLVAAARLNASLRAATPVEALRGEVVNASLEEVGVSVPALRLVRLLRAAYPEALASVAAVDADDRHLIYVGPSVDPTDESGNLNPELIPRRQSNITTDSFLVTLRSDNVSAYPGAGVPVFSTDEMLASFNSSECPFSEGGIGGAYCALKRVLGGAAETQASLTPNVLFGASVTNATVAGEEPARATAARVVVVHPVGRMVTASLGPSARQDLGLDPPVPSGVLDPLDLSGPRVPDGSLERARWAPLATAPLVSVAEPAAGGRLAALLVASGAAAVGALAVAAALLFRRRVRSAGAAALLEDPTRQRILAVVRDRPGLTLSDLARSVGVAHNPVRYHTRLLAKAGLVVVARRAGPRSFVHVFPADGTAPPREHRAVAVELRSPAARAVAAVLVAHGAAAARGGGAGGLSVAEIVAAAGVPETAVRFHLRRLRAHEGVLVVARGSGGSLRFALAPEAASFLTKALEEGARGLPEATEASGLAARASGSGQAAAVAH